MKRISGVVLALALVCLWGCMGGSTPAGTTSNGTGTAKGSEVLDDEVFTDDFEDGKAASWTDESAESADQAETAGKDAPADASAEDDGAGAETPAHGSDEG
jgi:hypothetical protein